MVWCRKIWKEITSLRCEACSEAVEVRRQFLCGRQPGTPPDQEAIANEEARKVARRAEPRGRGGASRRPGDGLSVHMRDKRGGAALKAESPTKAPATGVDAPEAASGQQSARPARPSRSAGRRRGAKRGRGRPGGAPRKRQASGAEVRSEKPPSPAQSGNEAQPPARNAPPSGRSRRRPGRGARRKSGQRPSPPAQRPASPD